MGVGQRVFAMALSALASGCSGNAATRSRDDPEPPPECSVADIVLEDGGCLPPGIPADACPAGFAVSADGACEPVLPASVCPSGMMAAVGEAECHEVAPCGQGPWGEIPVGPGTLYVDASAEAPGDGTQSAPYASIQAAVDAAAPGSLVAVTDGTYVESLNVDHGVTVWGRCPSTVSIVSPAGNLPSLVIHAGDEVVVRSVAVTGPYVGAAVTNSVLVLEAVRIFDTAEVGVLIESTQGPAQVTIRGSLIEGAHRAGLHVDGGDLSIESSVIRQAQPLVGVTTRGVSAYADSGPTTLTLSATVVEDNLDTGVVAAGAEITVDSSVIRWTRPGDAPSSGVGLVGQFRPGTSRRAQVEVRGSWLDGNAVAGVGIAGSDAVVDATTVRGGLPHPSDLRFGRGITAQPFGAQRSTLSLTRSRIDDNHDIGVFVLGSDASLSATVIRSTRPRASDQASGRGLAVQHDYDESSEATLSASHVELADNRDVGLLVADAAATLDSAVISATQTQPNGTFGDGIAVVSSQPELGVLTIDHARVADNARAGLASFGGVVSMSGTVFECNTLDLVADTWQSYLPQLDDAGDNTCSCGQQVDACKAVSQEIVPPGPAD